DHEVVGSLTRLFAHLGIGADLTADDALQPAENALGDRGRAHRDASDDPLVFADATSLHVERRRYDDGRLDGHRTLLNRGGLDVTVCSSLACDGLACTPPPSARIIPPSMTQLVVAPAPSPVTPRLTRSLIGKKLLMAVTGVILFLFVVLHLLDLTFGRANPSFVPGDVYHNLVASFARWPVAAAYMAAMVVLGLHIYHGLWSAFQTLGVNRPPTAGWRRGGAALIALLITAGYVSIPAAVLVGMVR